ncbi:ABC transporter ATP-binding protein [Streptomyces sp. S1D4-11]
MKRFFGPVKMAEPQVSDAEQELFGGPLRYDMGWSHHEHAGLDLTMMSALRSMPALVGATLRMAWSADRRALLAVAVSEIGQGIASAVGLLAINAVMHALLAGSGDAAQRLHALLPGLLAAAAIGVVNSALSAWSTSRAGRLEPMVERIATTQYLAAAASVELEAIDDPDFRRLVDVAQYGPGSARRMIGACVAALNGLISLIATAGVLAVLHPVLLPMLILIAAPRGWGAMRVAQERYVSVMSWIEHVRASRLIGNLLTERSAAQEVRLHAVGAFLLSRYQRMAESAEAEQERLASSKALTEWVASALSGLAMAATYGAMFWLILAGHMSLAIGTAVIAVRTGSASLGALVMNINQLHEESLYVRDHGRFLAQAAQRTIPEGGNPVPEEIKEIVLDRVTYRYPDRDTAALDQVSLTLPMGSVTAVVGENGSGKSTLMKILSGMLLPQAYTLHWGEADISDLDRSQVFERVSLLTQDFQRWPVTAALNIRLGRPAHAATPQDLQPSVDYAGAGPVIAKLPDGLRSLLARMFRGAIELSGGEWQKVGLARTHWRSSTSQADSVLIVDEPTSALDPEAEIEAFDRIRRLAAPNRAVVLVTHRMSGVRHADRIYVLTHGRLAEHGTHEELIAAQGRYAAMFDAQAAQYAPNASIPNPAAPTVADPA